MVCAVAGLSKYKDETYSILDLILMWIGWRTVDANTSVLLKAMEYLESKRAGCSLLHVY